MSTISPVPCARYGWGGGLQERLPSLQQARWTHACGLVRLAGREAVIVVGGRVTSGQGDELSSGEAEGFFAYIVAQGGTYDASRIQMIYLHSFHSYT